MLEKVASIPVDCAYLGLVTKKTAFLLSLISVARISELTAFNRGMDCMEILDVGPVKNFNGEDILGKEQGSSG